MKTTILKLAVCAACAVPAASLPVAASAALVYTPPQAMVLTCNGSAPNVLGKTAALATFACANGQAPQAVGITSGLGDMLGLASGAAALVASEAVPSMALPAVGGGSGAGSNGSGSGPKGTGSNGGSPSNSTGAGANANNGTGSGSGANGSSLGSTGSNTGTSSTGSNTNGSGAVSGSGSNSGAVSGSGANGSGNAGQAPVASSGGGGFWGHLVHSVGQVAQQIGKAVVTGGSVSLPVLGGGPAPISAAPGSNPGNTGSGGFNQLNQITRSQQSAGPVSPMTGAAAGTIQISSQPQPFVLTGGPNAYRGLVRWVSGFEQALDIGKGNLNAVIHPGTVTQERLPAGPSAFYSYEKMTGYADFYITELGHRYLAYPGNPVPFVVQTATGMGNDQAAIWEAAQKVQIQATGTYSSGPQFYTSMPGNRNGPFWPSPFTLGGPEPIVAAACHGVTTIDHVSMAGYCWSVQP